MTENRCSGEDVLEYGFFSKALILGRKESVGELFRLLQESYQQVTLAENSGELENLKPEKQSFRLAVMTDSFSETLSLGLVNRVRQNFDPEKMICLSTDDDQEKERVLRSAGLIYFGSYRSFFAFAEKIINQTLTGHQSRSRNAMESRKDSAKALEKRLKGRSLSLKSLFKRAVFRFGAIAAEVLARVIEIIVASVMTLVFVFPLLVILLFRRLFAGTPVFDKRIVSGAFAKPVTVFRFRDISSPFCDLPLFLELFTGRLALAGTAIRSWKESPAVPENAYIRPVKPGIVSLWDIRNSSKIAHEGQQAIEWEYVFRKHLFYDFMLMLRALPVMLYSENSEISSSHFALLGLNLNNLTMDEAISVMQRTLDEKKQSAIYFVNPDCLNKMVSDREYFRILKTGNYVFPDGIGLSIAGKMLGTPLRENINGTDMLPYLCKMAAAKGYSVFLLGGKPGIAEKAGQHISETYGVTIAGSADGYFDHRSESDAVIGKINSSGAAILLVAFGAPLQEIWIAEHRQKLLPRVLMGVGGLFDFYSGTIRRAPRWMREIGFEWVYRIFQEPARMWRRYVIGNPLFLYRVMKWKVFTQSNSK
ncbi:MAG: WecB/TagA/CpsF family glycosyltransferase [Chlorobiaceae bacterium]|nr:WecB/TagA/CpsF family glycosyltransferase [Chlorobiaceae bacterium]